MIRPPPTLNALSIHSFIRSLVSFSVDSSNLHRKIRTPLLPLSATKCAALGSLVTDTRLSGLALTRQAGASFSRPSPLLLGVRSDPHLCRGPANLPLRQPLRIWFSLPESGSLPRGPAPAVRPPGIEPGSRAVSSSPWPPWSAVRVTLLWPRFLEVSPASLAGDRPPPLGGKAAYPAGSPDRAANIAGRSE